MVFGRENGGSGGNIDQYDIGSEERRGEIGDSLSQESFIFIYMKRSIRNHP